LQRNLFNEETTVFEHDPFLGHADWRAVSSSVAEEEGLAWTDGQACKIKVDVRHRRRETASRFRAARKGRDGWGRSGDKFTPDLEQRSRGVEAV
jgi:hypothetical protein